MSATYDRTDDYVSVISDAGRENLAAEIRHAHAEILMWTAVSVVVIAALVEYSLLRN